MRLARANTCAVGRVLLSLPRRKVPLVGLPRVVVPCIAAVVDSVVFAVMLMGRLRQPARLTITYGMSGRPAAATAPVLHRQAGTMGLFVETGR